MYGQFKVDANNILSEEDFLRIYDLIESVGRYELKMLRNDNEVTRKKVFLAAFEDAEVPSKELFQSYID